jgi:hypothetical protein
MKKIVENENHVGLVNRRNASNEKGNDFFLASAVKQEPTEHKFVQQIHEG